MYKFLFFLFFTVSAFFFFSWVIDSRYFAVYEKEIMQIEELGETKKILFLWSDKLLTDSLLSKKVEKQLDQILSLYNDGRFEKVILSGDKDAENGNIVLEMMDYLLQREMPIEDIIPDFYSLSLYDAVYRAKNVYELDDFYFLSDKDSLLKFLYISDRLDLDFLALSSGEIESGYLERVLSEWKTVFSTKIFSPDVYVEDKDPNYLLDY